VISETLSVFLTGIGHENGTIRSNSIPIFLFESFFLGWYHSDPELILPLHKGLFELSIFGHV